MLLHYTVKQPNFQFRLHLQTLLSNNNNRSLTKQEHRMFTVMETLWKATSKSPQVDFHAVVKRLTSAEVVKKIQSFVVSGVKHAKLKIGSINIISLIFIIP